MYSTSFPINMCSYKKQQLIDMPKYKERLSGVTDLYIFKSNKLLEINYIDYETW